MAGFYIDQNNVVAFVNPSQLLAQSHDQGSRSCSGSVGTIGGISTVGRDRNFEGPGTAPTGGQGVLDASVSHIRVSSVVTKMLPLPCSLWGGIAMVMEAAIVHNIDPEMKRPVI